MQSDGPLSTSRSSTAATRDRALVAFVARLGAVEIAHVMAAMDCGRTAAYRRVAVLTEAGLVERLALLRGEPALILPTRDGLRYAGLDALGVAVVRPGGAEHWLRCADVALRLEEEFGRDRLTILCESELGPWLDPDHGGEGAEIDLAAALDRREIVYFDLDSDRYPAASRLLASALVIDLAGLVGARQGAGRPGLLALDEFSALASEHVARLAARARGAGISLLLGAQSLADLRAARPGDPTDTMTEQIVSNVEYVVCHRIADPDSAERLARVGGTEPAWALTERVGGHGWRATRSEGTRTRQRDFRVGPDRFKSLRPGEAVLLHPTARRPARVIRVWPPEPIRTAPPPGGRPVTRRWSR